MSILAIDPGPQRSAYVLLSFGRVDAAQELDNRELLEAIGYEIPVDNSDEIAVEMVACYGLAVGAEVFETCVFIGRLMQVAESRGFNVTKVYRKDVKMHLCQSMRAKDGNIRQALIDKHGPVGTKKNPGKLYGVSGHLWAALAVADYTADTLTEKANP